MPIEQCRNIILLCRLRDRARASIEAHQKVGNRAVADIYGRIETWLDDQLVLATSGS